MPATVGSCKPVTLRWRVLTEAIFTEGHAVAACSVIAALPCAVVTQSTYEITELPSTVSLNTQSLEDKENVDWCHRKESCTYCVTHSDENIQKSLLLFPSQWQRKCSAVGCTTRLSLHTSDDLMQIDSLWRSLFILRPSCKFSHQNRVFYNGFGVLFCFEMSVFSLIAQIMYDSVTYRSLRELCMSFSASSCLFSPAAAQDVECVQSSSCLQGRTLHLYSVWLSQACFALPGPGAI